MSYLLDTHSFLWFINGDASLSANARSLIEAPNIEVYLSMASVWEMAIKRSLGKLELPSPFAAFIDEQCHENGFFLLDITTAHTEIVATLPFHHRDPFDRLLIAQSQHEGLPIIGSDTVFDAYGIQRQW